MCTCCLGHQVAAARRGREVSAELPVIVVDMSPADGAAWFLPLWCTAGSYGQPVDGPRPHYGHG